jgi:hypothetical protein
MIAAFSQSYWKSMESAFNALQTCCNFKSVKVPNQEQLLQFIWWGYNEKNWRYSTINSYVSGLTTLFKIKGSNVNVFTSYETKLALKGVKNLDEIYKSCQKTKKVFSFPLLQILGHYVAKTSWSNNSKRVFWTAACVMFFGSFRISEILGKYECMYDPLTTLLWKDIMFYEDAVRIVLKSPKVSTSGGISVDLFEYKRESCCPVKCLKALKETSKVVNESSPVFMFDNGKLLTPNGFNRTLRSLLEIPLGKDAYLFSSHSFRAAIPAALADHPIIASREEIMGWGRWGSDAYLNYTRLKRNKRKETFRIICSIFD